jgi:mannose-6-phosphate isomerase-like protein (cupin superfamily)
LLVVLYSIVTAISVTAQPVKQLVVPNHPSKYRQLSAVHAGAGKIGFTQLIGRTELPTNFLYLRAGIMAPLSGIGHHFYHNIEEMCVILNGEAEFMVNGRTATAKAPAVVPCNMGDANASGEPLKWLNFAVSLNKGRADNFGLGDTRVGAIKDHVPVFESARLESDKMRINPAYSGTGVLYRRLVAPEIFSTDWSDVDHVVIPARSADAPRQLEGSEEVYYVIKGNGTTGIDNDKGGNKAGDAFNATLGVKVTLTNDGTEDLELLGEATTYWAMIISGENIEPISP